MQAKEKENDSRDKQALFTIVSDDKKVTQVSNEVFVSNIIPNIVPNFF